ncbi:hypothetical protein VW29_08600 [Devosia limi DSM 17137]|uniref:Uncharacterized protein n=1 Tax=Devosia limi DSM 17137 TaxID=1121477 RepID=A0A0F5LRF2_9HYPH|nr:hypothetical protein VW29_08600 [Devosia limi DSM 17137]
MQAIEAAMRHGCRKNERTQQRFQGSLEMNKRLNKTEYSSRQTLLLLNKILNFRSIDEFIQL